MIFLGESGPRSILWPFPVVPNSSGCSPALPLGLFQILVMATLESKHRGCRENNVHKVEMAGKYIVIAFTQHANTKIPVTRLWGVQGGTLSSHLPYSYIFIRWLSPCFLSTHCSPLSRRRPLHLRCHSTRLMTPTKIFVGVIRSSMESLKSSPLSAGFLAEPKRLIPLLRGGLGYACCVRSNSHSSLTFHSVCQTLKQTLANSPLLFSKLQSHSSRRRMLTVTFPSKHI